MKKRLLALAFTLLAASALSAAPFKVIVNSSVRIDTLSRRAASDLFLKKTTKWDSGAAVVAVDQVEATGVRDAFSRTVHGKTAAAVKSYWNQQIFSGRDVPPVEKRSDAEVLAFVKATPGAIGYVSETAAADGVRVISVE